MEWMIDTANLDAISEALSIFPIAGVTTNPTILKAEWPFHYEEHLKAIRRICADQTMHVQVYEDGCESMIAQAEKLCGMLGRELYLKVPATVEGMKAIRKMKTEGYRVTATAIYSTLQGMLAIEAGADYLAPYCNRMEQNETDFGDVIAKMRRMIDRDHYPSKILGASFKNASQLTRAIDNGAHAVTVPPEMLKAVLISPLVADAVAAFNANYRTITGMDTH